MAKKLGLYNLLEDLLDSPLFPKGDVGALITLYGPPESRKTELSLAIALSAAKRGALVHYFDINFSLLPDHLLPALEAEADLPLRIYRPNDAKDIERVLDLLGSHGISRPEAVILDSLILMGRMASLRDLQVDPLYLYSLMKRFTLRPRRVGVVVMETNIRDLRSLSPLRDSMRHMDTAVRSSMAGDHLSIHVSHRPFSEEETYRVEHSDLSPNL